MLGSVANLRSRPAGTRRPQEHHVLFGVDEVELGEMQHRGLLHRAPEAPVELLESLAAREARGADAALATMGAARGGLAQKQRLGEALVAPLFGSCPFGELGQRTRRGGRLEGAEDGRVRR